MARDPSQKRFVNLACGESYLSDPSWFNLDYTPAGTDVTRTDLLGKLPLADHSVDLVYCSHFVEHIPRKYVLGFLRECRRILRPGGTLRIVVPDFEEMCTRYLESRRNGDHRIADYYMLEILDQCVRRESGGALAQFYSAVRAHRDEGMAQFVFERCGENLRAHSSTATRHADRPTRSKLLNRLHGALERRYIRWVCRLLPSAFQAQNVSLANVGELHAWLYDTHSLTTALRAAGFENVEPVPFDRSREPDFPVFPLDVGESGQPRKGRQSLFIEGIATATQA